MAGADICTTTIMSLFQRANNPSGVPTHVVLFRSPPIATLTSAFLLLRRSAGGGASVCICVYRNHHRRRRRRDQIERGMPRASAPAQVPPLGERGRAGLGASSRQQRAVGRYGSIDGRMHDDGGGGGGGGGDLYNISSCKTPSSSYANGRSTRAWRRTRHSENEVRHGLNTMSPARPA